MKLKHRVCINLTDEDGNKQVVLKGGIRHLPSKIVTWLFGQDTEILVLKQGRSIDSVEIREIGGDKREQN